MQPHSLKLLYLFTVEGVHSVDRPGQQTHTLPTEQADPHPEGFICGEFSHLYDRQHLPHPVLV